MTLAPLPFVPLPLQGGLSTAAGIELSAFLLIGLLGGAHCLGMCGPLVTMYAREFGSGAGGGGSAGGSAATAGADTRGRGPTFAELRQHLLFNLGRTVSYAILGGLFGLLGALLFDASDMVLAVGGAVRATAGLAAGLVIVGSGMRYLGGGAGGGAIGGLPVVDRVAALFGRLQGRLDGLASGPGIAALGLVHGLLPCPLLYPAYLYAFVRGDPVTGVVTLTVLGLGTIPTLFAYGTVVGSVDATSRDRLHRALGVAFVVLGLLPIAHALSILGVPVPHVEPPIYQPLAG